MKLRHAAALALVGWYLMLPPDYVRDGTLTFRRNAPLAEWQRGWGFRSEAACKEAITSASKHSGSYETFHQALVAEKMSNGRCIASDDPKLKPK
jgi:hypothetical protein